MKDENRTKADLSRELKSLRRKLARLEKAGTSPAAPRSEPRPRRDREKAEQELRESEARYQDLYQSAPVAYFSVRADGTIKAANDCAAEMTGYQPAELRKMKVLDLYDEEFKARARDLFERFDRGLGFENEEVVLKRKDGRRVHGLLSVSPVLDREGRVVESRSVMVDISERKEMERELARYRSELEKLVEERTRELAEAEQELIRQERLAALGQLAGGIGHELLNPLGVVKNSAYFLNLVIEAPDEKVRRHLQIIDREINRSKKIVTDLLSLTRTGPRQTAAIEMARLLDQALEEAEIPEEITVRRSYQIGAPPVALDPEQLRQVFKNLIANAVQALKEGDREKALTVGVESDQQELRAVIEDTGPGIPPHLVGKVFDPLFTTRSKGFGLGLTVCKQLVEVNQGRIKLESKPGRGARFTVSFPLPGSESEEGHD